MFCEAADLVLRQTEHLGYISKGTSCLEGRETAHNSTVLTAIFFKDKVDYVFVTVVGKVDVDVGKFVKSHPFLVEKAPEVEAKPEWADIRNPQAIANQ